jgi:NADH-quinone oxidoreductase subunit N
MEQTTLLQQHAAEFPVPTVDWLMILPIVLVMVTGVVALIVEVIRPKQTNNAIVAISLIGLVAAGVATAMQFGMPDGVTLAGMLLRDRFALAIQLLVIGATALTILFSEGYLREKLIPFGEFYPLVLWSASGAMLMATSTNLLVIFLGLEVLSIALYVLAGLSRGEHRSSESSLKYFLLGAFATGFLLYGIAFFYGATGSLFLGAIPGAWAAGGMVQTLLLFGLALMLVGLAFKSSFVPFHQWTPDVYQGAPTNVSGFMGSVSKIGAIAALFRVLEGSGAMQEFWLPALFWIAILTMVVGNAVALVQKDVKRILGYSSIAHAGYILVGILAYASRPGEFEIGTVVYYLLAYSLMTVGAFAVVSTAAKDGSEGTALKDLNGLWRRSPLAAFCLVIFVCSLIGIPPTAGFFGKMFIFSDAIAAGLPWLAIVLAATSAISVAYYLSIGYAAFVADEEPDVVMAQPNPGLSATIGICAAGLVLATVLYQPLMNWLVGPAEQPPVLAEETAPAPLSSLLVDSPSPLLDEAPLRPKADRELDDLHASIIPQLERLPKGPAETLQNPFWLKSFEPYRLHPLWRGEGESLLAQAGQTR